MKRRDLGMLAGVSAAAASLGLGFSKRAFAGVPADQAALLKTSLTPFGADRNGNADGSIPAWTGGYTEVPAGWTPTQQQPDFFAADQLILTIDNGNVAQYENQLSFGLVAMIKKYDGFTIKVYPTHRTAAAPQWVYDNIYQNALHSSLSPKGGRFGFVDAYGGIPFPILDKDPDIAGPQVIWNHLTRWDGSYVTGNYSAYVVSNGRVTNSGIYKLATSYPYYSESGSVANFNGWEEYERLDYLSPPVLVGQTLVGWVSTNPGIQPTENWELLNGQGRVRKAPELTYDTPQAVGGGISNYDESYGFYGAPDRYNWKLLGKKEIFVPYNNNALIRSNPLDVLKAKYIDPSAVRFEKHRVWVVDATLAAGERHSIPHRRVYVDEDNWHSILVDEWDADGNLIKSCMNYNIVVPSLPGTIFANQSVHNLQFDQYVVGSGIFTNPSSPGFTFDPIRTQYFNPSFLASSAQY